jgi:hypothetical protein
VQAIQPLALEAASPLGNRVGVTAQLGGDAIIPGFVSLTTAEDDPSAEGNGLRCRVGVGRPPQLVKLFEA